MQWDAIYKRNSNNSAPNLQLRMQVMIATRSLIIRLINLQLLFANGVAYTIWEGEGREEDVVGVPLVTRRIVIITSRCSYEVKQFIQLKLIYLYQRQHHRQLLWSS